jgi:hypothetical protein
MKANRNNGMKRRKIKTLRRVEHVEGAERGQRKRMSRGRSGIVPLAVVLDLGIGGGEAVLPRV